MILQEEQIYPLIGTLRLTISLHAMLMRYDASLELKNNAAPKYGMLKFLQIIISAVPELASTQTPFPRRPRRPPMVIHPNHLLAPARDTTSVHIVSRDLVPLLPPVHPRTGLVLEMLLP